MKKWWIIPIVFGVGVFAIGAIGRQDNAAVSAKTAVIEAKTVEQTVSCHGVIEAGELTSVTTEIASVVDEVTVQEGQSVKAGDTLFTIDKKATRQLHQSGDRMTDAMQLATMPTAVVAPTDGIVVSVEITQGATFEKGTPCITIAPRDALQVRVMIREKLLPSLEVGQTVKISGAGFDKENYNGCLTEISSNAGSGFDTDGSVVEGVVTLDEGESDDSLRLGLTAKVKVIVSRVEEGLVLPYGAVMEKDGESYVYLLEDGVASYTPITPLTEFPDGVLVSEQTLVGRTLILEPEAVTQDGMPIRSGNE